ncbi:MAG: PEP-CTERM sorting domain-containing protein [Planctomycetaceae bacterium]|nr:PEP-CTERM sorting domain-containing protein [Planctomycetaceae bacterium]
MLISSPAFADAVILLNGDSTYTHILKNGTTPFTATVTNDSAATENLDWAVDNNATAGLTLSDAGTNLAPGGTASVSGSYTGTGYGTVNIQAGASGTVSGTATAATGSPVLSSAVSINVGYAVAADVYTAGSWTSEQLDQWGTPLYAVVPADGSYADLSVKVLASGEDPISITDVRGTRTIGRTLGTEMIFRAGSNTGPTATTISISFRNRTDIETNAVPYVDGLSNPPVAYDSYGQISDVANVTGVTGVFVLQSDYDENAIVYTNPDYSEQLLASQDWIYLGWFEPGPGGEDPVAAEWTHATEGNSAVGSNAVLNFQGSWDDFTAERQAQTPGFVWDQTNLALYLGSYGVDIDDNTVWAILDHNSAFSVVPEPLTLSLLLCGSAAAMIRRRRTHA